MWRDLNMLVLMFDDPKKKNLVLDVLGVAIG